MRHYLTACDAAYVALTEALEATLIIRETSVYRGARGIRVPVELYC